MLYAQGSDLAARGDDVGFDDPIDGGAAAGKRGDGVVAVVHCVVIIACADGNHPGVYARTGDGTGFGPFITGGDHNGDTVIPGFFHRLAYRVVLVGELTGAAQ